MKRVKVYTVKDYERCKGVHCKKERCKGKESIYFTYISATQAYMNDTILHKKYEAM